MLSIAPETGLAALDIAAELTTMIGDHLGTFGRRSILALLRPDWIIGKLSDLLDQAI